ncbi:MAG: CapA family protein [Algoriphagus sp.]
MKKVFTIFSIVLLIGIFSCGGTTTPEQAFISIWNKKETSVETNRNSNNLANDSIPLIVMGSFLNLSEDISLDSLKIKLENGSISCTKDIAKSLQGKLKLRTEPKSIQLGKFNFKSRKDLVITTLDSVDQQFLAKKVNSINFFKEPTKYPLWLKYDSDFDFQKDITTYTHTGVTAITRSTGTVLNARGIDFYLANILPFFKNRELVHISNEVSNQDACVYETMKMKFATKTEHFEILNRLKANVIELTGNHNLDVGQQPYLNSLKWYKDQHMKYFGGGASPEEAKKPLIIELKDHRKIAWIGFNELCPLGECADKKMGANRYEETKAKNLIDSLRNEVNVDYILACVQYGEVDSYSPTPNQKKISQKLIDFGADVILGSQAHQAQEIALYKGKVIFYGLGNFMFDQIHRLGVRQAFFLEGYFYKGKIIQFQPVYTFMNQERQPTPANDSEKLEIQNAILKEANFLN